MNDDHLIEAIDSLIDGQDDDLAKVLTEVKTRLEGMKDVKVKMIEAFHAGERWAETYSGWFVPTEDDHRVRIDKMLEELLP